MRRAVIIGATSGIGEELARQLSADGIELGLTGRRVDLLQALAASLPTRSVFRSMDVTQTDAARQAFDALVAELGGTDCVILNAGISDSGGAGDWSRAKEVIDTNITGFVAVGLSAVAYFRTQGGGHLVGISSVASQVPNGRSPVYSGTKAFVSTWMQGLRARSMDEAWNIDVTDIRPGFVHTPLTARLKHMFWAVDADHATRQIVSAIRRRAQRAYVPKRWWLIHALMWLLPYRFINRISSR